MLQSHIKINIFIFFVVFTLFSIAKTEGSSPQFNDDEINFSISYLKDKEYTNLQIVGSNDFVKFPNSYSLGNKNGVYWIRLDVKKNKNLPHLIAYVPTHNIDKIKVYKLVGDKTKYITTTGNSIRKDKLKTVYKFPSFEINLDNKIQNTYFLKVTFPKEANFPVKIIAKKDFLPYIMNKKTINSIYYGTALVVLILNLFFFLKLKILRYFFHLLFLLSLTFNFLLYDGSLIGFFRGNNFYYNLEFLIHLSEIVCLMLYSISFLDLKSIYPKFVKNSFLFPISATISYLFFLFTNNFSFSVYADILALLVFPFICFVGFTHMKKVLYSKLYMLNYFIILPLGIYCFLGNGLGYWSINGDLLILKIGGWFNLVIFAYGIINKIIFKNEENEKALFDLRNNTNTQPKKVQNTDPLFIFLKENHITTQKLTLREIDILKYLNEGLNNNEISEKLFISTNTVKYHIRNIYTKTQVNNRTELKKITSQLTY